LISEGMGISELSIEAIASRAGVGKTTIYRRWSNKEDLVVDALSTLKAPVPPLAGTSVRDDLISLLDAMRQEHGNKPQLLERFVKRAVEPRRQALRGVIERGVASGELRADVDVDLGMAILSGAMLWHTKWGPAGDLPVDLAERIVDAALAGMAP
jgi:AcrR family transcriptional regulator